MRGGPVLHGHALAIALAMRRGRKDDRTDQDRGPDVRPRRIAGHERAWQVAGALEDPHDPGQSKDRGDREAPLHIATLPPVSKIQTSSVRHADHVAFLHDGIPQGGVWADLGSGEGAFTLALAELLGPGGQIHSVDTDASALRVQREAMKERVPEVELTVHRADFTQTLDLPPLDGIVMANSLHFHRDQVAVVRHVVSFLKPGGRFIVVEYDAPRGNAWVPHPVSYKTWEGISAEAGLSRTHPLHRVRSRFMNAIYSALSYCE